MSRAGSLARRLAAALEQSPPLSTLESLAKEYADACRTINQRLEKCHTLLAAHNDHQALQEAETHPPILDQLAELEFGKIEDWRSLCAEKGLIEAERIDTKTVRQLNDLYAKGLASTHTLYKRYREAMLRRNRDGALEALRQITKVDPKDRNAQIELARMEGREPPPLVPQKETTVKPIGQTTAIPTKVPSPSAPKLSSGPRKPTSAQLIAEARALFPRLNETRRAKEWSKTLFLIEKIQTILKRGPTSLPPEDQVRLDQIEKWALLEQDKAKAEEERQQRAREIEDGLVELEAWLESDPKWGLAGWRAAHAKTVQLRERGEDEWERLGELKTRLGEVEKKIETSLREAERLGAIRAKRWSMAALAVALVLAGIIYLNWQIYEGQTEVQLALDDGRITEARQALNKLRNKQVFFVGQRAQLRQRLTELSEQLDREDAHADKMRAALATLSQEASQSFQGLAFREVGRRYEDFVNGYRALAKEFQVELQIAQTRVAEAWEKFVEREREASVRRLATVLKEVEEIIDQKADFRHDPVQAKEGASALKPLLAESADFQLPVMRGLNLPADVIERARRFQVHADFLNEELGKLDEAQARMKSATKLSDYLAGLEKVASSQFLESNLVDQARRVARRNLNDESFAADVIMPETPQLLEFVKNRSAEPFHPDKPTERERSIYLALRDEVDLNNIFRCVVSPLPPGQKGAERVIYSRGAPKQRDSTISGALVRSEWNAEFYDPAHHPSTILFEATPLGFSFVTRRPNDLRIVQNGISAESDLFRRAGLADWIDPNTGHYRRSLLKILDQLRADPQANSLFVSFLFLKLIDLASERPERWGVLLSPTLRQQARDLRTAATLELLPSDWMVPRRREMHETSLKRVLDSGRSISFLKEAELLREFYGRVVEEGFSFGGFVRLDGKPEASPKAAGARELWGLEETTLRPTLLFQRSQPGEPWRKVNPAQPLTPVFAADQNREQLWADSLKKLQIAPGDPSIQAIRPPFVQDNYGR
jgi:hypothetical protein